MPLTILADHVLARFFEAELSNIPFLRRPAIESFTTESLASRSKRILNRNQTLGMYDTAPAHAHLIPFRGDSQSLERDQMEVSVTELQRISPAQSALAQGIPGQTGDDEFLDR